MNIAEALIRPDAWRPIKWSGAGWRVGRILDDGKMWHRAQPRRGQLHGRIITFRILMHAQARADRLNVDDAKASMIAEAKAVTP